MRKIWWAPNNASQWQMGFNLAFKGLKYSVLIFVEYIYIYIYIYIYKMQHLEGSGKSGNNMGQSAWRPRCVLLLSVTRIRHKGIFMGNSTLFYRWQWSTSTIYTERIVMFPLSRERSTMLRHTYSVCFVSTLVNHIKGGPRIAWVWGRL